MCIRDSAGPQLGSPGMLLIVLLSASFFLPLRQLGSFFHVAMNGMTSSKKIFALLDAPAPHHGEQTLPAGPISVHPHNLGFFYGDDEADAQPALRKVSLDIPAHSLTAIVGESGSGKSTLAALIAVGAHYNNRINTLSMQVNDLRSQLYSVQSNLSNQINGISNNVSDILTRESSLISQYNYEITNVDLKKQECTIAFSLLPKTISEGTTVIIGVTDHGNSSPLDSYRPGYSADLTQDGFGYLHGSVTVPLSDELGVGVNFKHDGETQSEELDTIYDLKSRYQPQLIDFIAPISYERRTGKAWQYSLAANPNTVLGSISLGALSDVSIRSACLEYTRANQLLRRVMLEASCSDGSGIISFGDSTAEAVAVPEGAAYYDLSTASGDEPISFSLSLEETPLVCELVVKLADDTVLRVRLFQVRAIAGGDSYEEINYRDQSLSEPLPFIVKYPDEQS